MKIGVFDSGIGGLTVVKSLLEHRLFDEIIYFGDTARVPYGVKDQNTIIRYALEAVEFFKNFDIDLLIVACNTVSAYALDEMKQNAPFDIVGVVEPGILAAENSLPGTDANILVLGTKATIASKAYEKLLHRHDYYNIEAKATGLFVPIVEEGLFGGEVLNSTMRHYFGDMPPPDAIILGCTHFPLISDAIGKYFNNKSLLIHSGEAIVEYLQIHYDLSMHFDTTDLKLFASENPDALKAVAHKWLDL
ncbi:MAG: glutamate racemase [Helicobacteraceae bacterium 4484_230]|nr:MAG: glutamate racemase [Helicobacteraceae bacterium 4484_230]